MIIDFHVHVLPPEDMPAFTSTLFPSHRNPLYRSEKSHRLIHLLADGFLLTASNAGHRVIADRFQPHPEQRP
jgi:hypothetical protein